jgi:hypothetical protein
MKLGRMRATRSLLAAVFVCSFAVVPVLAQDVSAPEQPRPAAAPSSANPAAAGKTFPRRSIRVPSRAKNYYRSVWGIDDLVVRQTASGTVIRFSYRVLDPERATQLVDKQSDAYMVGVRSHAILKVPTMDKIGQLRQTGSPVPDKEYWMVFSNKGSLVRPGDRVNVVIGSFHADGLIVE